ncbi:MAG TPA: hypothetical protein VFA09_24710 [Ktedonobacteraceae bacterium]|nr:hypothetical protein [Ktedonobacteraceae bacterium]
MSLTWHLRHHKESDVGDFLRKDLLHVTSLTRRIKQQLRSADTLLPFAVGSPYRTLEKAIYYRIGYGFADTTTQDLHAWHIASHVAWRMEDIYFKDFSRIFEGFFQQLESALALLQPAGRHLDVESEQMLARYCFVLGLIEEIFRTKSYRNCPLLKPIYEKDMDDLLAIPLQGWIDDLTRMFAYFYDKYSTLLYSPSIINPTFLGHNDLGKESADLIVDRCLIEIKTNCEPKIPAAWLRQLAGSVLFDFEDEYHIHSVGIYMARQGEFLSWSLEEFFYELTGGACRNVAALRQEFRLCCEVESMPW